jgi:hypothetical protein
LDLGLADGARTLFVVGTGKNVGKTTALTAIYDAASGTKLRLGLASIGHKPGARLRAKTVYATARSLLSPSPAGEILEVSGVESAAGPLVYVRAACDGSYELIGPSNASGLREVVQALSARSDVLLVDGAVDRIATLAAGSDGAIVIACGAAAAKTAAEAVSDVAALAARLRIAAYEPSEPWFELDGALTATVAAGLIAARETRQIVVRDATAVVMSGTSLTQALARLRIRCRRPLRVVAATVCSAAPERTFEPAAFLRGVAEATGLPAFDVFAGREAA